MSRFLLTNLVGLLIAFISHSQQGIAVLPGPHPEAGTFNVFNFPPDPEDTIHHVTPLQFCDGGSVVLIANSAPPGATFQWLLNNGNITGATNSTYLATASGIYSVVVMTTTDTVTYDPVTVTEFPNPIVNFSFNNNDACSGTPVQFISNITSGTAPFTYAWDFGDGATSTLSNPVHTFTSLGCATEDFTVTLVITDVNGCTHSIQKTITVKQVPDVNVADVDVFFPFSNCENDPTQANPNFDITLTNNSPSSSCIVSYSINWGDGNIQNNVSFPISHTYTSLGAFQLQVTALGTNGCSNTRTYTVANQTNPAGGLGTLGATTGLCAPAVVPFVISNWQNNSPGTTYLLEFGDGTSVTLTHPLNDAMTADTVYHTYTESSCPSPTYTATLTVINACDETPYTAGNIQIREKPGADFTTPENVCVNTPVCFTNETQLGNFGPNCSSVTQYEWNFGDGSPTSSAENPCHTYTTPGTYTVTLTATNPCGSSVITRLVCVVAPLTPAFTIDNNEGCAPLTVTTNNITPVTGCQPPVFNWSVNFNGNSCNTVSGWSFINGTDANSVNPQFQFTTAGNYTIVLQATNACGTFTTTREVLVEAPPILTLSSIPNACGNATITPTAVATNCGNGQLAYAWTFSGGTPSTSALPNPGPITFNSPGTHTVSLTVTSDCGPVTQTQSFTIYPVPGVNNPGPQSYCPGATTSAFNFTGTQPGATYSWINSNPAIGLPASGSGSVIPSFVTVNNGSAPISGTITMNVTANGCNYTEDFTITINPNPPAPVATNPVNYCQGSIGAPLTATALPGHTLNWYTSATGGTPSTTAPVPDATNPGTTSYYVSQTNTATGCEGPRAAIDVIVNPSPAIGSFSSTNPTACGTATGTITLTGLTAGLSYTVNYVKNGSPFSVTLVANASGNIIIPNLTAGNYTDIRVVLNFCPSNFVGPILLVDPNPPATPVVSANSLLCVGSTLQLNASTTTGGAVTYNWTGPGGFTSTDQNPQITNVTFANAGQYTVTVTINSCSSSESVMVDVNPTPGKPQVVRPVEYCLNATASPLSATPDAGNTLTWYDNQALTNGTPNAFTPATNAPGTTMYYVTQTNSFNCVSDTAAIAVIVYPSITGNIIGRDTTLCSGNAPNSLTSQSTLGGGNGAFTFQWQISTDGGVTWSDIPGATNASYSPGPMSSTTHYRRKVWSGPCGEDISNAVVITVQGTLSNTGISADQVICANTSPAELNGQAPSGGTGVFTYEWEVSTDNVNWTIIPGANAQNFQPPVLTTTTYYRRKVSSGACNAYSAPVEIIVNPIPVATPIDDLLVCNTSTVPAINFTSVPANNVSFAWTNNNLSIGLGASGSNGIPAFIATNSSNPETVIAGLINVTPTYTFSGVSCQGNAEAFTISVLPTVTIDDFTDLIVCTGTAIPSITPVHHAAPSAGASIVYNWQVSGSGITLPSTGSGTSIPSFITINNGTSDLVATVIVTPVFQFNGKNCEGELQSFTVTVKSATPDASGGPDVVLCAADSYTMQAIPQSGVTGLWTQYSGPAAVINNATDPDAIISGLQPGQVYEFIWTVTGFASCPATTDTVRIDVKEELSNSINTATQTICFGQSVTIDGATPTGGNGAYNYQWEMSADQVNWTVITGQVGEDLTFSPTETVYIRRIVSSPPCMNASMEAMVIVQPAISSNAISADQSVCINNPAALLQGTTPAGGNGVYSFQWQQSTDGGSTWTDITSAQGMDFDPGVMTVTTKYRRIVTTSLCAGDQSSISNEVTITVNPDAEALFIPTADTSCAPFNLNATVIGLQPFPGKNEFYNWYADGTFIGAGVSFPGYTITGAGQTVEIKLVVTSPYGCKSDSMSHVFATPIEPNPSFTYSPASGCGPLMVNFMNTTPLIGEFTYHWDFGNGQTSTDPQPGSIEFLPNPTFGDTTYNVTLSAITQCTTIVVTHPVTVHSKPKALFAPNVSVGCSPMTVSFNNTSLGIGNNYVWDFGDGSVPVTTNGLDPVSHTFYSGIQDTFFVQLVAINQCGSDTLRYAIVVSPNAIQLDYAINGNEFSGCTPHTVQFINNSSGATLFTWDFGDNNIISTTDNIDTITHTYLVPGTYTVTLTATNGCSDTSSVETIIVYPLPQSQFTASDATACIGNVVQFQNQSSGATSYLWNFGDNTTSTLTDPTHTYSTPGTYTVSLITYSFNAPGTVCTDTSTQLINVVTTLPGDFDASAYVGNCAPFVVDFTNNITPSVTASWDFGDGATGTGDQISHTYQQAGVYHVSLTVMVPGGCTYVTTKTITINGPIGTWTHTTGYLCEGRAANFQVTANNFDSLIYDFGDGTNLHTTDNFVYHTYANPGVYFPSVILKNNAGCEITLPGIDSIRVDAIEAGFASTQVNSCGSTKLVFTDTSHVFFGKDEVLWDFGDGTQGSGGIVEHNYTAQGLYQIRMIVTGLSGCADTVVVPVDVRVNNIPLAEIVSGPSVCTGVDVVFGSNIQSTDPINLIKWELSNGATGVDPSFTFNFTQSGTYTIRLIVGTVNGCYDTTSHTFQVNPTPQVNAGADHTICLGASIPLVANGINVASYSWSPMQGLSCYDCPNPIANPTITTPYVVQGMSDLGCPAYDTVVVTVIQPLQMTASPSDSICIGQSIDLLVSGAASYAWTPAQGLSSTTVSNPTASPTVTTTYRVVGYDGFNCFTDTAFITIGVGQYPTVNLGPDLVLSTGTMHPLTSIIQNGPIVQWDWTPSTDLSCDDCELPIAEIKKDITYEVKVTTAYGCSGVDSIQIKTFCEDAQVFIPNAFTPDGDGYNDILMVRARGVAVVKSFRIFNRWGELVFERGNHPPNSPQYGWDGKVKGVAGPPEVYVYTAEVVCENGTIYTYKGNVTLLK